MRDLSTDNSVRIVGSKDDLMALGLASIRDCDVEGQLVFIAIPAKILAGTPEQITAFVAAAVAGV